MFTAPSLVPTAVQSPLTWLRRLIAAYPRASTIVLILLWTCVVRLPFLHVLHDDEAFYSAVASRWLRGEIPYADSFDVKAPGIFALFAAIQAVFGVSLYVIKGTEIIFTALGALGLYHLLARHVSVRSAVWAAFLYPIYSLALNGVGLPCEIIQATTKIWAFAWLADIAVARDVRERILLAALSGLTIGCSVTLKQTAVFEGAGLFGWLAWQAWQARKSPSSLLPLVVFAIAGAAPILAFIAYFAATGHLAEAYTDIVTIAYQRSQLRLLLKPLPWYVELSQRFALLVYAMLPLFLLTAGVALVAMRRARLQGPGGRLVIDLGLIWYVTAMAGIVINREPAPQYVTALIAPSILLFCLVLCEVIDFPAAGRRIWIAGLALLVASQPLIVLPGSLTANYHSGEPDYRGAVLAAQALRDGGAKPGDNTLVVSRGHYIYVMSGTLPRAKYFNAMHLLCDFPVPDRDSIETAFASRPQYVVLSDPTVALGCAKLARMRRIQAKLASDYTVMSTVHGDWDSFAIYRRKP